MASPDDAFWPAHEPAATLYGIPGWHFAALICRSGHVLDKKVDEKRQHVGFCSQCGADVLTSCPSCGTRIKGILYNADPVRAPMVFRPSPFCDGCGSAMPWATRRQRVWELKNILDQQDIDEADRILVTEQLQRLQQDGPSLTEGQERELWTNIKKRAPELFTGTASTIIGSLISAAVKPFLGLQ